MTVVDRFMCGQLDAVTFSAMLECSPEIQEEVRGLIPAEAVESPEHPFWQVYSYDVLLKSGFAPIRQLNKPYYKGESFGHQLNLYATISHWHSYSHPDFPYTKQYHDMFNLFITACGESFDGPEVTPYIESILKELLDIKPKTRREKEAKQRIREAFHCDDRRRPYWVQGSEWPMGVNSPMKFVKRVPRSEEVHFLFRDVDTGEERVIVQYY